MRARWLLRHWPTHGHKRLERMQARSILSHHGDPWNYLARFLLWFMLLWFRRQCFVVRLIILWPILLILIVFRHSALLLLTYHQLCKLQVLKQFRENLSFDSIAHKNGFAKRIGLVGHIYPSKRVWAFFSAVIAIA